MYEYLQMNESDVVDIDEMLDNFQQTLQQEDDDDVLYAHYKMTEVLFSILETTPVKKITVFALKHIWNNVLESIKEEKEIEKKSVNIEFSNRFNNLPNKVWIN
jgi:hypothetical protein